MIAVHLQKNLKLGLEEQFNAVKSTGMLLRYDLKSDRELAQLFFE